MPKATVGWLEMDAIDAGLAKQRKGGGGGQQHEVPALQSHRVCLIDGKPTLSRENDCEARMPISRIANTPSPTPGYWLRECGVGAQQGDDVAERIHFWTIDNDYKTDDYRSSYRHVYLTGSEKWRLR